MRELISALDDLRSEMEVDKIVLTLICDDSDSKIPITMEPNEDD